MPTVALTEVRISTPSISEPSNHSLSLLESKTIAAAKIAFARLTSPEEFAKLTTQLELLPKAKLLPNAHSIASVSKLRRIVETSANSSSSSSIPKRPIHRTELLDPAVERARIEEPSMNAVLRLCYLSTFEEGNAADKVPFTVQDLDTFILSKQTRDRTYRGFNYGMIPFTVFSIIQGFASLIWPSSTIGQSALNAAAGTMNAGLGIFFTGFNPDHSQDCLNEKVDKLNRVQRELDEVARSLITFCFYKDSSVRKLAQIAADEINIDWIEQAATMSKKYAITKQDIAPTLELLIQAVDYIRDGITPENPELNNLLSNCLKRKEEYILTKQWQSTKEGSEPSP